MPIDENIEVVKCSCGKEEYYGMMHWLSGKTMCRECIYTEWEKAGKWSRTDSDHVFPLYDDGKDYQMKIYYVSLVRGLVGYYVKFLAPSETIVRMHLAKYFGRLWCSIYSWTDLEKLKTQYNTTVINEDKPIKLLTEEWE